VGVAVRVKVEVAVGVAVRVVVVEPVIVGELVAVKVCVDETVGGSAVGETEAASLPTVISTPQTWGSVRVAE
jgi:hypothetical protein